MKLFFINFKSKIVLIINKSTYIKRSMFNYSDFCKTYYTVLNYMKMYIPKRFYSFYNENNETNLRNRSYIHLPRIQTGAFLVCDWLGW